MIKKLILKLPRPIKESLKSLYLKWNLKTIWDDELLENLVEFYNKYMKYEDFRLNKKEAKCLCRVAMRINADLWRILNPKTEEEVEKFYEITPYYPFELAYWHMQRYQRKFRKEIVNLSFGEVLEYGAGIGDLCIELAKRGLNVTYVDVQSMNMEFAKFIFKKKGYKICILDAEKDWDKIWEKYYDTIICLDVIEHLTKPKEVLEQMAKHLRKGGKLIITGLNYDSTESHPMHFRLSFDVEKLLTSYSLRKEKDFLWVKI